MKKNNLFLRITEILVIGGILFAVISPLFSPEEEEEEEKSQIPTPSMVVHRENTSRYGGPVGNN